MAKITIEITTDNQAFEDGNYSYEVARILKNAAKRIETRDELEISFKLLDSNGNVVGWCQNEL